MNTWTPFYDFGYTHYQITTIGWLFTMFSYNDTNKDELSADFSQKIATFANSLNRRQSEQGNGIALNKTARQLYRLTTGEAASYEREHYRDSRANWVGQIFVMLNWKYGIPCKTLSTFNWNEIYKLGAILHETSCTNACRKIMEKYEIQPLGNDPRMRF